jgi:hypothetical protein
MKESVDSGMQAETSEQKQPESKTKRHVDILGREEMSAACW